MEIFWGVIEAVEYLKMPRTALSYVTQNVTNYQSREVWTKIDILFPFFMKKRELLIWKSYIDLKKLRRKWERQRDLSADLFPSWPQGLGLSQELQLDLPFGWWGLKLLGGHPSLLFSCHEQGTELEVEQSKLELKPVWDADLPGDAFTQYVTVPALFFLF